MLNRFSARVVPLVFRLRRLVSTLRHLKIRQLVFLFLRRGIRLPYRLPGKTFPKDPAFKLQQHSHFSNCIKGENFEFLNEISPFTFDKVQWRAASMTKLWRYNLHYFDYLSGQLDQSTKDRLITHWITHNPYPFEDAWEPYPASLRIINWIKYFHQYPAEGLPDNWLISLYCQGDYLSRHIEWQIDANHLLKNVIALVLWSHFFTGPYAAHWQKRSVTLLKQVTQEQFNADGGHYERSPMYHHILLYHLLDAFNCIKLTTGLTPAWLEKIITQALGFSQIISMPDTTFPLIKDSAYAIAPNLHELMGYASALGIALPAPSLLDATYFHLAETGYFVKKSQQDYLLFDVGQISPSHQPGHAHCDALHVEVVFNGRPIFTDTGVFCYAASKERFYSRSVRAHNTLSINGQEQHEIWDAFRVGKRGETFNVQSADDFCSAEFSPYFSSKKCHIRHKRFISVSDFPHLKIVDSVEGYGTAGIEIFWHLAPGLHPALQNSNIEIYDASFSLVAVIKLQHKPGISMFTQSEFFPEFGRRSYRHCVLLKIHSASLPFNLAYEICKVN